MKRNICKNGITVNNDIKLSITGRCRNDSLYLVLLSILGSVGTSG